MCKTWNAVKEIANFITYYKVCKQCINKKDATDRMRQNTLYYQKHKDFVIKQNINHYLRIKNVNCGLSGFLHVNI